MDATMAQSAPSSHRSELEVTVDAGASLSRNPSFQSWGWMHEYSIRIGIGKPLSEEVFLYAFLQYDLYHSSMRWGDMSVKIFDKQYTRHDPALYLSCTFWRWLCLGAGVVGEFTPDMHYRFSDIGIIDSTIQTLKASMPLKPYFIVGIKQDIALSRDVSVPVGVYLNSSRFLDFVFRAGLCKQF
jgi:hypothetical protein